MAEVSAIADQIQELSLMDAAELVKTLEERLGVSAAAAAVAVAPAGGGAAEAVEEQTEFTVVLTAHGVNKIKAIKAVREITSLGLKEAKGLVDSAPKPVRENVSREEAEEVLKKLQEAGAEAEIK